MPVQLVASRCPGCDRWEFPARTYCPACNGEAVPAQLGSSGRIRLFSAVLHQPPGALIDTPYAVALVDFPEGLSVLGVVTDARVEDLHIGQPVTTVGLSVADSVSYGFAVRQPPGADGPRRPDPDSIDHQRYR